MLCAASLHYPVYWQWSLTLQYFSSSSIYFQFFDKYNKLLHFLMIHTALLLIMSFIWLNIFVAWSLKDSQNNSMQCLPLYTSCLLSMLLNEDNAVIEKPDGIYALIFFFGDELSGLFLHPSIFFYYTIKICINNKCRLIRFLILIKF